MTFPPPERTILDRRKEDTDDKLGTPPGDRTVIQRLQGAIVNLDKPPGPTSRKAADQVARLLGVTGTGHSGTLDPAVTGVLPVGIGRGTRVLELILDAGKVYEGTLRLHGAVSPDLLEEGVKSFEGTITQTPPVRSRVKRVPRQRTVYRFEILQADGRNVRFRADVQAGTYIRKLAHDLGERLGCGAHMTLLRRTRAGPFGLDRAVTVEALSAACDSFRSGDDSVLKTLLLPMEAAFALHGSVWAADGAVPALCHGTPLYLPGVVRMSSDIAPGDTVAVLTLKGEAVAIGTAGMSTDQMMTEERGRAVALRKVLMDAAVYEGGGKSEEAGGRGEGME